MIYRLTEDCFGLMEGSCVSQSVYQTIRWFDKAMFEVLPDWDAEAMIEHKDEDYCRENNVERLLFYSRKEVNKFIEKVYDIGID